METWRANPVAKPARGRDVRPIGAREHYIGVGVLAFVMLFCTWVMIRGLAPKGLLWGAYDPALFAGAPASAATITPPGDGAQPAAVTGDPGETQPVAEGGDDEGHAAPAAPAGPGPAAKILPIAAPDGWTAGPVETFNIDTLSNKINGRAEAYIAFGFQRLECCSYSQGDKVVDLFIYDQSVPQDTFGMFATERAGGEESIGLGQDSYKAGNSLFFWQQQYYVQVIPAAEGPELDACASALAQATAAKLPTGTVEIPGLGWFPKDGLLAGGVAWAKGSALGQEWLTDTYTGKYKVGDKDYLAFLARRETAAETQQLYEKYQAFLKGSGKMVEKKAGGQTFVVCDQGGMFDIVFLKGTTFGGVSYTDDRAGGEKLAAKLAAGSPAQ